MSIPNKLFHLGVSLFLVSCGSEYVADEEESSPANILLGDQFTISHNEQIRAVSATGNRYIISRTGFNREFLLEVNDDSEGWITKSDYT